MIMTIMMMITHENDDDDDNFDATVEKQRY